MPDLSPSRLKAIKYRLDPESSVRATGSMGRQGSFEVLIYPPTLLTIVSRCSLDFDHDHFRRAQRRYLL